MKAAHLDLHQPSTRSTKLNQKVQLGSFGDDSGKVELQLYTSYRTASPYSSTRPDSPPSNNSSRAITPLRQDNDGPMITELTVKKDLEETVGTFKCNEEADVDKKDEELNLENTNEETSSIKDNWSSSYSGHKILESSLSTFSGLHPEAV